MKQNKEYTAESGLFHCPSTFMGVPSSADASQSGAAVLGIP